MNKSLNSRDKQPGAPRCPLSGPVTESWDLGHSSRELCPEKQELHSIETSARMAWRNSVRCIGRLHWKSLDVVDCRSLEKTDDIYEALLAHLKAATNAGAIRPSMTLFKHWENADNEIRVWNHQLIRFPGSVTIPGITD